MTMSKLTAEQKAAKNAKAAAKRAAAKQLAAPEVVQQETPPPVLVAEAVPPVSAGTRKIEKNRPVQNGVTRPSAGGLCRDVWDFCEASNGLPTVKEVKAHALDKGWNVNNASIEYYQYRKFMGIRGRATSAPASE